jgi:hypothetical protein
MQRSFEQTEILSEQDLMPRSLVEVYRLFGGTYYLLHQGLRVN